MSEKNVQRGPSSIPECTTRGEFQPTREAARAAFDRSGKESAQGAGEASQRRWEDDGGELPCRIEAEHQKEG